MMAVVKSRFPRPIKLQMAWGVIQLGGVMLWLSISHYVFFFVIASLGYAALYAFTVYGLGKDPSPVHYVLGTAVGYSSREAQRTWGWPQAVAVFVIGVVLLQFIP